MARLARPPLDYNLFIALRGAETSTIVFFQIRAVCISIQLTTNSLGAEVILSILH